MTERQFDAFLAHSSIDKPLIRQIYRQLKARGLNPWLDEEEIAPGTQFQDQIQQAMGQIKTAVICIGKGSLGRWQALELKAFISQCVERNIPVIPVLLPGVGSIPDNLLFLREFHAVFFHDGIEDERAFFRLEWGITGRKPTRSGTQSRSSHPPSASQSQASGLESFDFDVVMVNAQGQEIARNQKQAQYFAEILGNGVCMDMVQIPGGSFFIGSPETEAGYSDERPQHEVVVPTVFMGKIPVRQIEWRIVASFPKVSIDLDPDPSHFKGANRPVEQVSWHEAVEFCQRLSRHAGRPYRLPSEAEWEYACRAGTQTPFYFGETITTDLANYRGTDLEYEGKTYPGNYGSGPKGLFRDETTTVGQFPANAFGLFDLHGNVWEWCLDHWHDTYEDAPTDGSAWINGGDDSRRVLRGGSWFFIPGVCRSACRLSNDLDNRDYYIGFRVVCVPPRTL